MMLERLLAGLLHYGAWAASAIIGAGLGLALAGAPSAVSMRAVTCGIALFILLPVLRVVVMLVVFLRARDYRFGAIAALVLAIIATGFALGRL